MPGQFGGCELFLAAEPGDFLGGKLDLRFARPRFGPAPERDAAWNGTMRALQFPPLPSRIDAQLRPARGALKFDLHSENLGLKCAQPFSLRSRRRRKTGHWHHSPAGVTLCQFPRKFPLGNEVMSTKGTEKMKVGHFRNGKTVAERQRALDLADDRLLPVAPSRTRLTQYLAIFGA